MKHIKSENGVTMVSLIVTIIVMIILAGVSINVIFSENGVISAMQGEKDEILKRQQSNQNEIKDLNNKLRANNV